MIVRYENAELQLPDDTVKYFHRHGNDLYVVYVRSVLRIRNFSEGNLVPEEAHTLEMADYYSYEDPMMINDPEGGLWCHIGGRLFKWENRQSRWIEKAQFTAEKVIEVNGDNFVFANHLQYDENPEGRKSYNYKTGEIFKIQ